MGHEKVMGPHGFLKGSYHFWSLKNPIRGPLYRPPWVVGGIHNPTIDPERHFNQQDRFLTVNAFEYLKFLLYPMLGVRVQAYMAILPVCGVLLLTLWSTAVSQWRSSWIVKLIGRMRTVTCGVSISITTTSHTSCVTAVPTNGAMPAKTLLWMLRVTDTIS